ncbi:MAG: hypothetical protein AB7K24_02005 [Gemmataceae bacterium]
MKTIIVCLGLTLAVLAGSGQAWADGPPSYYPNYMGPLPPNPYMCQQYPCGPWTPDACGPGFYAPNCHGAVHGPNYNVHPPFPPFNGARPCFGGFPQHLYARSPRDFFMID